MAKANENVIEVKPQVNIYTVLMLISIIVLVAAIVICGMKLTGPVESGGYGLTIGELFQPLSK